MSTLPPAASTGTGIRAGCTGVVPLPGRLTADQADLLGRHAELSDLLEEHGSPVNLLDPSPLTAHAAELVEAADAAGVELRVFFARKANKALALVDAALAAGHGIDVSSERELSQVLARGAAPERVILTAAVKPRALLELAVTAGVAVSVDGVDELAALVAVAGARGVRARVVLRLCADLPGGTPPSRFGMSSAQLTTLLADPAAWEHADLEGFHFHLHGYDDGERAVALDQSLDLVVTARTLGHHPTYVDIGGGVPMRYLDDPEPWQEFWDRHRRALAGDGEMMTWRGRGLGLTAVEQHVVGTPAVYPMWQEPVRGPWLTRLLQAPSTAGGSVGRRVRALGVRLHAEPGRALLDGCGLTVARVEACKQGHDGRWWVSLAMNRTQCRSAADDFLLDPVLVPARPGRQAASQEGYLVGAYCIEAELLTSRRLVFPHGVQVGDLVAFVNTAGYQMHILESASHQIPLARNLVHTDGGWVLDDIDAGGPPQR